MLNELGVVVIVIYVSIAGFRVLRERKKSRMKMANLVRTTNRIANIKRKEQQHKQLTREMIAVMKDKTLAELGRAKQEKTEYVNTTQMEVPRWAA